MYHSTNPSLFTYLLFTYLLSHVRKCRPTGSLSVSLYVCPSFIISFCVWPLSDGCINTARIIQRRGESGALGMVALEVDRCSVHVLLDCWNPELARLVVVQQGVDQEIHNYPSPQNSVYTRCYTLLWFYTMSCKFAAFKTEMKKIKKILSLTGFEKYFVYSLSQMDGAAQAKLISRFLPGLTPSL